MIGKAAVPAVLAVAALIGCSGASVAGRDDAAAAAQAPNPVPVTAAAVPAAVPGAAPGAPADFSALAGEFTQGGWLRGRAPGQTVTLMLDGRALPVAADGSFFGAFDRDTGTASQLVATLPGGRQVTRAITVSPRSWQIERVNVARRPGGATAAFMARREPELARINAARRVDHDIGGWRQSFIWPVKGRISGRFGSQRIYQGEPASYHSGLDIATGASGTPFVAPADGVVVLAAQTPFSLEGHLLMIDHGNGLNSAFLHCSKLAVKEGDVVRQGQYIGNIGATGRATGPHLHWGMKWREARLDPLLFTGPMN